MIERFDAVAPSNNHVYRMFSETHIRRYVMAVNAITMFGVEPNIILDMAAGLGYGSPILSEVGTYLGLDICNEAISKCKKAYPKHQFGYADFDRGDHCKIMQDNAVNTVVSLETAEHLKDANGFIQSIYNNLPNEGLLLFSAPTSLMMDFDPYHLRDWNSGQWANAIKDAGFTIKSQTDMPFEGSFYDFFTVTPTTFKQKLWIVKFLLKHPSYLANRVWNWGFRQKFFCQSTFYVCTKG